MFELAMENMRALGELSSSVLLTLGACACEARSIFQLTSFLLQASRTRSLMT